MKESLVPENAANERFFSGVFRDARRESELNQDALFVSRVPMRSGDSYSRIIENTIFFI